MHGLKALSLANAFVPQDEVVRRARLKRERASWARRLAAAAARRPVARPAPRVRRSAA